MSGNIESDEGLSGDQVGNEKIRSKVERSKLGYENFSRLFVID